MTNAFRLARHEWRLVLRDPRFMLPFFIVPLFLVGMHGAILHWSPGDALTHWMLTRSFLGMLCLAGSSMAVPLGADAFAGEKERGSWETLLCLPLPRREIFIGKVLGVFPFPLVVGWLAQILTLLVSRKEGGFYMATTTEWLAPFFLNAALSLFLSALTVLISLRCDSVRMAAQTTGIFLLFLYPAVGLSAHFLLDSPGSAAQVILALTGGAFFCFFLAARRFRRF